MYDSFGQRILLNASSVRLRERTGNTLDEALARIVDGQSKVGIGFTNFKGLIFAVDHK